MTYCKVIYCNWLSYEAMFLPLQRIVTVLWTRDRPICLETEVNSWRKKKKNESKKTVSARGVTWQRTLQIDNANLDRSRCWQHLQEATTKSYSFTVSWQKQIKLCVSSQKGEFFKLSTLSFESMMLIKAYKKLKLWFALFENTVKI